MRVQLIILYLSSLTICCSPNSKSTESDISFRFRDTDTGLPIKPDKKITETWKIFSNAVYNSELSKLRELSTTCIDCLLCTVEDNSDSVKAIITNENFYNNYFNKFLNKNFISKIMDTSRIKAHYYDDGNRLVYAGTCIAKNSDLPNPRIVEVFVKIQDPRPEDGFEGGDAILSFIETKKGYKFCGYSTMP